MQKELIIDRLKNNTEIQKAIAALNAENVPIYDFNRIMKNINEMVFSEFCVKNYLQECELAYCVFRISSECPYLFVLDYLKKHYGIDLINGKRVII